MADILKQEFSGLSLVDAGAIALSKVITEEALSNVSFVGNGTYRSALIKGIGGIGLNLAVKNKYVGYVSTGLIVDAFEDAVLATKRQFWGEKDSASVGGTIY